LTDGYRFKVSAEASNDDENTSFLKLKAESKFTIEFLEQWVFEPSVRIQKLFSLNGLDGFPVNDRIRAPGIKGILDPGKWFYKDGISGSN